MTLESWHGTTILGVKKDGKTFLEVEVLEAEFLEKIDDGQFKK